MNGKLCIEPMTNDEKVKFKIIMLTIISYSMIVFGESARLHGGSWSIFIVTYLIAVILVSNIVKGEIK